MNRTTVEIEKLQAASSRLGEALLRLQRAADTRSRSLGDVSRSETFRDRWDVRRTQLAARLRILESQLAAAADFQPTLTFSVMPPDAPNMAGMSPE